MGRYPGPVEKLERREGVSLELKGKRQLLGKTSLERRRPIPPGQQRRLDNVVFRLGLASTRRQARQFVGHGHLLVDGRRLDIASTAIGDDQVVQIKPGSPIEPMVREAADDIGRLPAWLQVDHEALAGRVLRAPQRDEIAMPVNEQLVIERYARR